MKCILIGPVYPYKGGIAHFTSLIGEAFINKGIDTEIISFTKQYPKIIFPGKEQTDYTDTRFKKGDYKYMLNSTGYFSWRKTVKYIKQVNPDYVVLQWWNPFFAFMYLYLIKKIHSKTNAKVKIICHNVLPHEKIIFDKFLTKRVFKRADEIFVLSKEQHLKMNEVFPKLNSYISFHPPYHAFINNNITRESSRENLNLVENHVLLFFGFIREYKGLDIVLESLKTIIKKDPLIKLLVVGDFYDDRKVYDNMIHENQLESFVDIYSGYIPDDEVAKYFEASDLLLLPYKSATQSGISSIGHAFNKPMILTNVGGLPESVIHKETGYLIEVNDCLGLDECVMDFFENNRFTQFSKNTYDVFNSRTWEDLVTDLIDK